MRYAAIYGRSSLGRDRQGETIEHQIEMIKEFAKRSELDVTFDNKFIYEDEDSGFKTTLLQRPAMRQLLSDIDSDMVNVVFFKGISRFARDSGETITTAKRLHNKGVRVISLEENFDSSKDDPTMFQIYAVMAEQESRKTAIRVSLGNKAKARRGLWSNASTPYGYNRVKDLRDQMLKDRLIKEGVHPHSLHPNEYAPIVERIFDMYVNKRIGKRRIAMILNEEGYKTSIGNSLHAKYITDMLKNEAYIGNVIYGKSRYEYVDNDDMTKKIQRTVNLDRKDWAIAEGVHPPIIDKKLFNKAQEISKKIRKQYTFPKGHTATKHPLSGILICNKCGRRMTCQKRTTRNKDNSKNIYRYYICSTYHNSGRVACSQVNLNAGEIEQKMLQYIRTRIYDILNDNNFEGRVSQRQKEKESLEEQLNLANHELENKLNSVKALIEAREIYDGETFIALNKEINEEIKLIRERKKTLKENMRSTNDENVLDVGEQIKNFGDFEDIPQPDLRELFSKVFIEILMNDKELLKIKTIPL